MAGARLSSVIEQRALHILSGAERLDTGLGGLFGAPHLDEIARIGPFCVDGFSYGAVGRLRHSGTGSGYAAIVGGDSVRRAILTLFNVYIKNY